MIEGITILNKTMIMGLPEGTGYLIAGGVLLAFMSCAIGCIVENKGVEVVCIILSIVGVVCFFIGVLMPKIETGRYQYEALIDESVPFADIYEKYEVVEQRGEIWVLKDRIEE